MHISVAAYHVLPGSIWRRVTLFIMRLAVISLLAMATVATADWWYFDAWDGLSCGDAPQNGQVFLSTEGTGEHVCISFEEGQRAYSYAAGYISDDTEARGFLHEHCEGPSKTMHNNSCTNPSVEIPYIRSWKIIQL